MRLARPAWHKRHERRVGDAKPDLAAAPHDAGLHRRPVPVWRRPVEEDQVRPHAAGMLVDDAKRHPGHLWGGAPKATARRVGKLAFEVGRHATKKVAMDREPRAAALAEFILKVRLPCLEALFAYRLLPPALSLDGVADAGGHRIKRMNKLLDLAVESRRHAPIRACQTIPVVRLSGPMSRGSVVRRRATGRAHYSTRQGRGVGSVEIS